LPEGVLWIRALLTGLAAEGRVVDGAPHLVCGVVIFTVASELAQSARFYLEPGDEAEPA
jgi:hypothetical protein